MRGLEQVLDHGARRLRLYAATSAGAALVIGSMLILSVPLRRLRVCVIAMSGSAIVGLGAGAVGYGVVVGGTSGSGVILLSLLMAAGSRGRGRRSAHRSP